MRARPLLSTAYTSGVTITSGRALPAGRQLCCDLALSTEVLHIQRVSTARVSLCY